MAGNIATLSDIEAELVQYKDCFSGKAVYCPNCEVICPNDPLDFGNSPFFQYFHEQFERLGLRLLVCSWQVGGDESFIHCCRCNAPGKASVSKLDILGVGSRNFVSRIIEATDIVVSSPDTNLSKTILKETEEFGKNFIMCLPPSSSSQKELFSSIRNNKAKVGRTFPKNGMWFTNMKLDNRGSEITIWNKYSEGKFPKYCNLDNAIDVPKCDEIPLDWEGLVGTSTSFLSRYNPKQFKIWGLGSGSTFGEIPGAEGLDETFAEKWRETGSKTQCKVGQMSLGYYDADGTPRMPSGRVVVQLRKYCKG